MRKQLALMLLLPTFLGYSQGFQLITLGSHGGVIDGDLSGYLLKGDGDEHYIALDAGTILPGIAKALAKGSFKGLTVPADSGWSDVGYILREKIKGYLISHAHLDHISGMVIASTEDTKKEIYGLQSTINVLKNHVFNWQLWPNFANQGTGIKLNQYHYQQLVPREIKNINGTKLQVQAFPLSHGNYQSTMFLVENQGDYLAYYGDVGPDSVEKSHGLEETFKVLAPLLKEKKLKGIMIESSYDCSRQDKELFGHLTPCWIDKELEVFEKYAGKNSLNHLNIIITHIKPDLRKNHQMRHKIATELRQNNRFNINYHFPVQGDLTELH